MERVVKRYRTDPTLLAICIGKRGQGKSTLARDLLYRLAKERILDLKDVLVLSGTGSVNPHQYIVFVHPSQTVHRW
jgi:hypothetical protein